MSRGRAWSPWSLITLHEPFYRVYFWCRRPYVFRPPGTLVPKALCFTADVFYPLFFSPRDLRAPSADRRETLPHDRNLGALYNASPKFGGPPPKEIGGQKHAKFGAISDDFRLRARISPECVKISKIGKKSVHQRFLPRSTQNVRWTLVHKLQRTRCEFGTTQSAFFRRLYFGP